MTRTVKTCNLNCVFIEARLLTLSNRKINVKKNLLIFVFHDTENTPLTN